jgi:phage-related minor tail protein
MELNQADQLIEKTDKYKITLEQVKDVLANQMTSAIVGLIDGTKSLKESLSGLLRQFGSMFLRAGMGSLVNRIFPSAKGNVFAQNGIVPYAKGGYIGRPTMALMGEAGPEAVLPLRRGRGGRLGVETSGGGVGSVVVNVDASGSSVQGNEPDANQLGRVIGQAVQAELIKQKRPGGLLTR